MHLNFITLSMECYHVVKSSLETFSGHYLWSRHSGQKSELTLKEIVEVNIKIKKAEW